MGIREFFDTFARPVPADPARASKRAIALCHALLSEKGEASGARLAREFQDAYHALNERGRRAFFDALATEFAPDSAKLTATLDAYRSDPSPAALLRLQAVVEPPRQEVFRRINLAAGGTALLVQLRREVLRTLADHPGDRVIDADLLHLLRSWFNRGFLELRRIDWHTSAVVLERLIRYEAVHAIHGWDDLRRRLQADRRCYAFFHPALEDEPLIFIEVALTRALEGQVQPLLNTTSPVSDPTEATCALFYSITNCQEGLRGVSFGNFLIKQVVEDLGREFPKLKTFATLSPVTGFRSWLADASDPVAAAASRDVAALVAAPATMDVERTPAALRAELLRLGSYYLLHAKRDGLPRDAVARFHLANGARLERLNWGGDTSPAGLERALGLTVNYVYRLADVEANHEAFAQHRTVAASAAFERQARALEPARVRDQSLR